VLVGTGKNKPNGPVLLKVGLAHGRQTLPAFTPQGEVLYVTFVCAGDGVLTVGKLFDFTPCQGHAATMAVHGQKGIPQRLAVDAPASTSWRILIMSGR
jgi:hypothetical protein